LELVGTNCSGENFIIAMTNIYFFLLYFCLINLFCDKVFFYSSYVTTHPSTIFALADIQSSHCTSK